MNQQFPEITVASALEQQRGGSHYRNMAIQPIEFIHANGIPFAEGSVIKYVSRWRSKNGIADLEKARHFIDLLIELERKKQGATAAVASKPEGWHGCGNVGMEASE